MLSVKKPSTGLWILFKTGLLTEFLPEIFALDGVEEIYGRSHKNNLEHTFKVVDKISQVTYKPMLRFSALFHDIGKPGTKKWNKGRGWTFDMHEHLGRKIVRQICKRLHFSVNDTEYVAKLVRWHQQPIQLMDEGVSDSAVRRLVFNLGDNIDDLLKLCRSDITTGNPNLLTKRLKNYDILENRIISVIEKDKLRAFQSPVRGDEIMEICNLSPGPEVGKYKKAIEEAILDGEIENDYEQAKDYLKKITRDLKIH
jgi:tRNA nucleotidyltransferase (CCA-adding enzyme)